VLFGSLLDVDNTSTKHIIQVVRSEDVDCCS